MTSLAHALCAEWIKTRRTFLRLSPVLFTFLTLLFPLFIYLAGNTGQPNLTQPGGPAMEFAGMPLMAWVFLMLPLFALQVAILSFHGEHSQGMWKHLNAQPIHGASQVMAKHLMGATHLAIATLCLVGQILFCLLCLGWLRPGLGLHLSFPTFWKVIGQSALVCLASGLVIIAPLMALAARFPGLGPTLAAGFLGLLLGCFLSGTDPGAAFLPWSMGKVWMHAVMVPGNPWQTWWVIPPILWVLGSLIPHLWLQRRKPLF